MSTSIFPLDGPVSGAVASGGLPLYREVKWDLAANKPVYAHGEPITVTGAEAVLTWAWNALQVKRGVFEALSRGYGNDVHVLTGRPYTDALKNAEAVRYIRECLTVNPYIVEVRDVTVDFQGSRLGITFTLVTVYGEVSEYGVL